MTSKTFILLLSLFLFRFGNTARPFYAQNADILAHPIIPAGQPWPASESGYATFTQIQNPGLNQNSGFESTQRPITDFNANPWIGLSSTQHGIVQELPFAK